MWPTILLSKFCAQPLSPPIFDAYRFYSELAAIQTQREADAALLTRQPLSIHLSMSLDEEIMNDPERPLLLLRGNPDQTEQSSGDSSEARNLVAIVRDIMEDTEDARERYLGELDTAIELDYDIIVIEPPVIAEETHIWLKCSVILQRVAVLCGIGSSALAVTRPQAPMSYYGTPAVVSLLAWALYRVSWVTDPCSRYEVPGRPYLFFRLLPVQTVERKDFFIVRRKHRKLKDSLVTVSALSAVLICAVRLFKSLR
ncbi:unnamed protein product [Cyprideis torosa]|uniref:Uncharacterized protein n=1 Tax=Cyprideis torosa TaxID=163714 RepID=A0A7R8WHN4_9CRUS|nr:unnamed protein product [Cyprideis torosa]CAG0897717.1 unnamed protein product [Cyprideis torosa]